MKASSKDQNGILLHRRVFHAFIDNCFLTSSCNSLSYLLSTWSQIVSACFLLVVHMNLHNYFGKQDYFW